MEKTLGKLDPRAPGLYSHACSISTEAKFWLPVDGLSIANSRASVSPTQYRGIAGSGDKIGTTVAKLVDLSKIRATRNIASLKC